MCLLLSPNGVGAVQVNRVEPELYIPAQRLQAKATIPRRALSKADMEYRTFRLTHQNGTYVTYEEVIR